MTSSSTSYWRARSLLLLPCITGTFHRLVHKISIILDFSHYASSYSVTVFFAFPGLTREIWWMAEYNHGQSFQWICQPVLREIWQPSQELDHFQQSMGRFHIHIWYIYISGWTCIYLLLMVPLSHSILCLSLWQLKDMRQVSMLLDCGWEAQGPTELPIT